MQKVNIKTKRRGPLFVGPPITWELATVRPRIIFTEDAGLSWGIWCFHHPSSGTLQQRLLKLRTLYPEWLFTIGYPE